MFRTLDQIKSRFDQLLLVGWNMFLNILLFQFLMRQTWNEYFFLIYRKVLYKRKRVYCFFLTKKQSWKLKGRIKKKLQIAKVSNSIFFYIINIKNVFVLKILCTENIIGPFYWREEQECWDEFSLFVVSIIQSKAMFLWKNVAKGKRKRWICCLIKNKIKNKFPQIAEILFFYYCRM